MYYQENYDARKIDATKAKRKFVNRFRRVGIWPHFGIAAYWPRKWMKSLKDLNSMKGPTMIEENKNM
jgi:hypothetical protein